MRDAIPPLPQYALMAWCSVKKREFIDWINNCYCPEVFCIKVRLGSLSTVLVWIEISGLCREAMDSQFVRGRKCALCTVLYCCFV